MPACPAYMMRPRRAGIASHGEGKQHAVIKAPGVRPSTASLNGLEIAGHDSSDTNCYMQWGKMAPAHQTACNRSLHTSWRGSSPCGCSGGMSRPPSRVPLSVGPGSQAGRAGAVGKGGGGGCPGGCGSTRGHHEWCESTRETGPHDMCAGGLHATTGHHPSALGSSSWGGLGKNRPWINRRCFLVMCWEQCTLHNNASV